MKRDREGEIITKDNYPDIYEWLCEYVTDYRMLSFYRNDFTLTINKKINVYNEVELSQYIEEIEHRFEYVEGDFTCSDCHYLTSLMGCPEKVGGNFSCANSVNLTSLIGSPKIVDGIFSCNGCHSLTSLIGMPEEVGEWFAFAGCVKLTSLIGLSKNIKGGLSADLNRFSIIYNTTRKEKYKLYLVMWLELLESVSNEDRKEYITNYKDKKYNYSPIIPIEILKEYGF